VERAAGVRGVPVLARALAVALFLWRLSRLPLALRATHPDRLGGLGPLLMPAYALAVFGAAGSSELAGAWADRMVHEAVSLATFSGATLVYAAILVGLALAPTLGFLAPRYRVRTDGRGR
jgi:hypothetical protein